VSQQSGTPTTAELPETGNERPEASRTAKRKLGRYGKDVSMHLIGLICYQI
jgi:hypothetical protein